MKPESIITHDHIRDVVAASAHMPHASRSFFAANGLTELEIDKILGPTAKPTTGVVVIEQKQRVRQNHATTMNKLETAWHDELRITYEEKLIHVQCITLQIANGCRYTPDFFTPDPPTAYEVKGPKAWDDSIVKLKVAARQYPWIQFILVSRSGGTWRTQRILP